MDALTGQSFSSFVDQLVLSSTNNRTLLIVFDATGAEELQPTDSHARHRSSPFYLHKAKLIDIVQIQTVDVLMALLTKLLIEKWGYGDGRGPVPKKALSPSRLAVWGLLSTVGLDVKIQTVLSRLHKSTTEFEIIIGEPNNVLKSTLDQRQADISIWDALNKWCMISKSLVSV